MPYLRVANVQDGFLDLSEIKEIDVPISQVARFTLEAGDLLLIEGNGNPENLGRGCIWDGQIADCVHQNHIFAVRMLSEAEMTPAFLALQLQSDRGRDYLLSCAKSSTGLSTLNSAQLKEFPVLVPSIEEQQVISNTVENWDSAIQKIKQLIAAKDQRLDTFRNTLLRKPERSSLAALRTGTQESTKRNGNTLGREAVMAVTKQVGMRPMREETIAAGIERYKVVPPRAFAYNPMRLNIGSIAMSPFDSDTLVSPDYVVFACNESALLPGYLHHLRFTKAWQNHFELAGNGSVRVRIYYSDLATFTFALPPIEVQTRIVRLLDAAALEIALLHRQAKYLREQKRGLMQKLLTGEWRLPLPEREPA